MDFERYERSVLVGMVFWLNRTQERKEGREEVS